MNVEQNIDKATLKNLIESRNVAKEEYEKARKILRPHKDKYLASENAIEEEFINQKLYIPIDKLPEYIGDKEMSDITVVYENGKREYLYHSYDISYETSKWTKDGYAAARRLVSGVADDGWSFERDIDEDHIVGFYNVYLENGQKIKETYMEEIIRKVLDFSKETKDK